MASKIEILIRNERESVIELSGVTDVNGHPVSLAPKGMEHDSRRCYDSVVTHQHVQTFLDQTPPWISVMKLNSDGTVPEEMAPTFDTSDVPPSQNESEESITPAQALECVQKIIQNYVAKQDRCIDFSIETSNEVTPDTHEVLSTTLKVRLVWRRDVPTEPAAQETVSIEPVAEVTPVEAPVEPTPELLPVDDDALGPLPDLEEPTETVETPAATKRRKTRNS